MSDYDIFKIFENLIKEEDLTNQTNQETARQKELGEKIKDEGLNAPKKSKTNINQNEEEDNKLDSSDEDESSDKVVDPKSPPTIHLKDALDYSKLKSVLNKFRASHSLKKPDIAEELKDYYGRLSKNEKKALYIFVKGLVQITGDQEAEGDEANIPSDFGIGITRSGTTKDEKRDSESSGEYAKKSAKKNGIEAPITVESIQDKREIYKVLLENK